MIRAFISTLRKVVPEEELESRVFLRSFGVITWVSFLFASLASMLFFASFEPLELAAIATFPVEMSPTALYSLGFFLFWVLGFTCTTCSCVMLSLPLAKRQKTLPDPLHNDVE